MRLACLLVAFTALVATSFAHEPTTQPATTRPVDVEKEVQSIPPELLAKPRKGESQVAANALRDAQFYLLLQMRRRPVSVTGTLRINGPEIVDGKSRVFYLLESDKTFRFFDLTWVPTIQTYQDMDADAAKQMTGRRRIPHTTITLSVNVVGIMPQLDKPKTLSSEVALRLIGDFIEWHPAER
jgi:hypothetical protein